MKICQDCERTLAWRQHHYKPLKMVKSLANLELPIRSTCLSPPAGWSKLLRAQGDPINAMQALEQEAEKVTNFPEDVSVI